MYNKLTVDNIPKGEKLSPSHQSGTLTRAVRQKEEKISCATEAPKGRNKRQLDRKAGSQMDSAIGRIM